MKYEKIIEIKEVGEHDTYDLELEEPYHHFFANNICVSNSHSASYAYLALQTLYLKNHYPHEYYTSLLTLSGPDDVSMYLKIVSKNINILPFDINKSNFNFSLEDFKIRMGLKVIKSFGLKAWEEVEKNRPFNTVEEFFESKIKWSKVNKRVVDSLIRVGAFDSLEPNRNLMLYWLENGKKVDRSISIPEPKQKEKDDWFYQVTGISAFDASELDRAGFKKASDWESDTEFVYGKVETVVQKLTKTGKPYYIVRVNDGVENTSFIVWDNKWNEATFLENNVILIQLNKNDFGYHLSGECYVYERG